VRFLILTEAFRRQALVPGEITVIGEAEAAETLVSFPGFIHFFLFSSLNISSVNVLTLRN
jgi:hypothetical protein